MIDINPNKITKELNNCLKVLNAAGEAHWSKYLDALDQTNVDLNLIEDILKIFGGMGSFNDLVLRLVILMDHTKKPMNI